MDLCGRVVGVHTKGERVELTGEAEEISLETGLRWASSATELVKFLKEKEIPFNDQSNTDCE